MDYTAVAREFLSDPSSGYQPGRMAWYAGELWRYEEGAYKRVNERRMRLDIVGWLGTHGYKTDKKHSGSVQDNVMALCLGRTAATAQCWLEPAPHNDGTWVALRNGLLDLRKRSHCEAQGPGLFTMACLPYDYEPEARCPTWERCMGEWVPDEQGRRFLQEWAGYLLTPDTSQQVALFLEGSGANGKSAFCHGLTEMLGRENVSSVPLDYFRYKFSTSMMVGCLMNLSTETDDKRPIPSQIFKQYVGGDPVYSEPKYGQPVMVTPTARLVFAWNEPPPIQDQSEGMWRRVAMVRFTRRFGVGQADLSLCEKLTRERAGILNWAIQGWDRLQQQGRFTPVESMKEAVRHLRDRSDPIRAFLLEHFTEDSSGVTLKDSILEEYTNWADTHNHEVPGREEFFKALKRVFPQVGFSQERRGQQRVRVLRGIRPSTTR